MQIMTNAEFDKTKFGKGDQIVVRKYFGTMIEQVYSVNFSLRTVNEHDAQLIIQHIKNKK